MKSRIEGMVTKSKNCRMRNKTIEGWINADGYMNIKISAVRSLADICFLDDTKRICIVVVPKGLFMCV